LLAALPALSLLIRSVQTITQWNNRRLRIFEFVGEAHEDLGKRRGGNAWRKRQLHGADPRRGARTTAYQHQRCANSPYRSGRHAKTPHNPPKSQPKLKIQSADYSASIDVVIQRLTFSHHVPQKPQLGALIFRK
jgi:hypothetical protein